MRRILRSVPSQVRTALQSALLPTLAILFLAACGLKDDLYLPAETTSSERAESQDQANDNDEDEENA